MRTSPTLVDQPDVQGPIGHRGADPIYQSARRFWINHAVVDWPLSLAGGFALDRLVVHHLAMGHIDPGVRFAFYAGLAGAALAFLTVAFTPLAIMVTMGDGASIRRLRAHDAVIRRQFLLGSLVLFVGALVILVAGALDARKAGSPTARVVAAFVVALVIVKAARLTQLFWAILAAGHTRP